MKTRITQDEFEDVLFNNSLIVVQKNVQQSKTEYLTYLYVFNKIDDKKPSSIYCRYIENYSTFYAKEEY